MNECQAKEFARAAIGEFNQWRDKVRLRSPQVPSFFFFF